MRKVRELAPANPRILDVGASYEAEELRRLPAAVDSLGFGDPRFAPPEGGRHIEFDLRNAEARELWPELRDYDVVVCAEVIEHLPISAVHPLRLLATALRPGGWLTADYFVTGSRRNTVLRRLGPFVPPRLRAGITVWLRRPDAVGGE